MKRRRWLVLAAVPLLLVALVALFAPAIVRRQTVRAIEKSGQYGATLAAVDLHWLRAAVTFKSLEIVDRKAGVTVFSAPRIDVDVVGRSLRKGPAHLSVALDSPRVSMPKSEKKQGGEPGLEQMREQLLRSKAFVVDSFDVKNGVLRVVTPRGPVTMQDVELAAQGITNRPAAGNVKPTTATLSANVGDGQVRMTLAADALDAPPSFDLDLQGTSLPVPAPAEALRQKLHIGATEGSMDLALKATLDEKGHYKGQASIDVTRPQLSVNVPKGNAQVEDLKGRLGAEALKRGKAWLGAGRVEQLSEVARRAREADSFERQVKFSGRLEGRDELLSDAIAAIVTKALQQLGTLAG